ncbi:MAG: Gldg family protein [Verrucomicrobia bacterium]|nr:Gldg family protein [Verrucomicrobiota bacterium]MBV9673856.1 Gldg family protein [Verrucomicrobiota bacterium]
MRGKFRGFLFSALGVVCLAIILIALNILGSVWRFRSDLTQNKLYTLSSGTKKILNRLDTEVEIRFYFSKDNPEVPVPLRTYAQEIQDLLSEYQQHGHGKIKVVKLDPKPDSDAEDSANLDGIEGQDVNLSDKVYLGLAVSCLDAKQTISFLSPERETLLEYDISRAIASVSNPKKAVIGLMSSLPVNGSGATPMLMERQQSTPAWVFVTELKENYQIRVLPLTADKIDSDITVLLLVHPKGISVQTQYAIDQFLLRGGKLVALLDPFSLVDAQMSQQEGGPSSSTLDKLLPAWGLNFSDTEIVADPVYATQVQRQQGVESDPTILSVSNDGINKKDALGAATSDLLLPFAGAFTGTPVQGLRQEILVKTSDHAKLVPIATVQAGPDAVRREMKGANTTYSLALRLSGKFPTAFPNGRPKDAVAQQQPQPSPAPEPQLKQASAESVVILVGDADFAYDSIAGHSQQILGQTIFNPSNGNLNFLLTSIEQLSGDTNLIGIRSRASGNRPFDLVNKMQATAEEKYQSKINELEDDLNQTREKLASLQTGKQSDQKTLISNEQLGEIRKFHEQEAKLNQELKQVRKNLRQEIDSLQDTLKWVNILGIPILVALFGVTLAWIKKERRAAK